MSAALLSLVQWLSPAFPTGAFAYSHGLEWAISEGEVRDAASARRWIADVLAFGAGRTDAILLAHALRGARSRGALGSGPRAGPRGRASARDRGAGRGLRGHGGGAHRARPAAAAAAGGAGAGGGPARAAGGGGAGADAPCLRREPRIGRGALRAIGPDRGQATLAALHPRIGEIAAESAEAPLDALGSAALRGDLAAMRHETQEVRIFKT